MTNIIFSKSILVGFALAIALPATTYAATVVASNDEWQTTGYGFAQAGAGATQYVANLVDEFGTSIHAYSNNFGYNDAAMATAMSSAGATYSWGTAFTFNLANISAYDAIFLGGHYLTSSELADLGTYVSNGGNVYIVGGTGVGGPASEAAAWNGFLSAYGMQMASIYNGVTGILPVGGDSLFAGVGSLYQDNGNTISGASALPGGLYGIWRSDETPDVPLPAAAWLIVTGIGALGATRLRRKP
jgi:hypothetical protein